MRNQEQELSVLCPPSSSMQGILNSSERRDLQLPFISTNEDSSWSKQPINDLIDDQQETNCTSNTRTDDSTTNIDPDASSNNDYDASHASLSENIPFVDDREIERSDFAETRLFLNRNQCESLQRKSLGSPCGRLGRLTGRASFMVESSLQRITGGERSDQLDSKLPEISESNARKAFRRQSKFRSIGRMRNGGEYAAPRMSTKDRKLLKMILVIFASFLVCYLPITVTKLFQSTVDWRGLNIAGYILIYLTTCINPVIYVVMSSEYRSAYKYVLLCKGWTRDGQEEIAGTDGTQLRMIWVITKIIVNVWKMRNLYLLYRIFIYRRLLTCFFLWNNIVFEDQ